MSPLVDQHGREYYGEPQEVNLRRWEAAKTDRLNKAHWGGASDQGINYDLSMWSETLRKRTIQEAANNSTLEGVIFTHTTDLIGARGPKLQILSDSAAYNEALENWFSDWAEHPDIQGKCDLAAKLRMLVRMLWYAGESLWQEVTDPKAETPIKMRLKAIHPRRLATPPAVAYTPNMGLGITIDENGRPQSYAILREVPFGETPYMTGDYDAIPARFIRHVFLPNEPDQLRGVPLAASCLQDIADLQDFKRQEMDAARAAADACGFFTAAATVGQQVTLTGDVEVRRRTFRALPPGYKFEQARAEHPIANYEEFTSDCERGIGRPVNMPLMRVRLDVSDYNYSSARLEAYIYEAGLDVFRSVIESMALNPTLRSVETEAQLAGLLPARPERVKYLWVWPPLPTIDPVKEAEADRLNMENRTKSWSQVVIEHGGDPEAVVAAHEKDKQLFDEKGLPLPPSFLEPKPPTPAQPEPAARPKKPAGAAARVYEMGAEQ
jgi:lambda family phage portal protein